MLESYLRHAMLVSQQTEDVIVPLNAQLECEGRLELANSEHEHHSQIPTRDAPCDFTRFTQRTRSIGCKSECIIKSASFEISL